MYTRAAQSFSAHIIKISGNYPKPEKYPKSTNKRRSLQAVLAIADLLGRNVLELFRISWRFRNFYNEYIRNLSTGYYLKSIVLVLCIITITVTNTVSCSSV